MDYAKAKFACFLTCGATAITANLPPLFFLFFREQFGVSFSQLGLLVVLNFGTQLLFDALFSFFSHRFNLPAILRLMPFLMFFGLVLYAVSPTLLPSTPFLGLSLGTVVFAVGSGLAEVLVSPTVAEMPSENPARMMSRLHSCYAWGVPVVILLATLFFRFFGTERWQILVLLMSLPSLLAFLLLLRAPLPPMRTQEKASAAVRVFLSPKVLFCFFCIFLGGASECTMSQWCSGYLETAFGLPKAVGDLLGVALFGLTMAISRSLFGKYGKHLSLVLFGSAAGCFACYLVSVVSLSPVVGLIACACTGFFAAMLWPGSLIVASDRCPDGGVALFALMAMGGDLGASLVPQCVGFITDGVLASPFAASAASALGLPPEQLAMKAAMAFATLFPLALLILYARLIKKK